MKSMHRLFVIIIVLFFTPVFPSPTNSPTLILISFDGFRWDYSERGITPNLDYIRENGVSAASLLPVFPSKTFPNHISIVTGLYPINHGIILNNINNPFTGERFTLHNREAVRDPRWYLGEFFWETAERQGITCGSYFWPGSEIVAEHREPTYREFYEHHRPYEQRVDGVLEWLRLPEKQRPRFVTLYFHETDSKGHDFGPQSPEINHAIARMDSLLGLLMDGLRQQEIFEQTNLIVVSDHGMTTVSTKRIINVENLLPDVTCKFQENGPFIFITPPPGQEMAVYLHLKERENHFHAFLREEIPRHFHFSAHPFIAPIMLLADMGWSLHTNQSQTWLLKQGRKTGGNHGYDNHHLDMHGIFYAIGPSFKNGYRTGTVQNIDIYPLLCKIFNIMPRQNIDGRLDRIAFILKDD